MATKKQVEKVAKPQRYQCVRKCYHRNQLWERGQQYVSVPGEEVPRHFVPLNASAAPSPVEDADIPPGLLHIDLPDPEGGDAPPGHPENGEPFDE